MAKFSPVIIVVACVFLVRVNLIGSNFLFYHSFSHNEFGFFASQVIAYLLYPLLVMDLGCLLYTLQSAAIDFF